MSEKTEPRPSASGAKGPGIQPDQDPSGFWHFRISKDLEICLSYNTNAYRPVRIRLDKPFVSLGDAELDQLIGFLAFTARYLKMNQYGYKWTKRVPARTHVPVKFQAIIGRIDRAFHSRLDLDLSPDAQN